MSTIGFVGLGVMGRPMVGHLISGGHTLVLNSHGGVPPELLEAGASACATGREVAERCEMVITMVPDTADVEAALFDRDGIAAGLSAGKT